MTASSSTPRITDGHPLDEVNYQRHSDLHRKARTLSEEFYKQLPLDASEWVLIGTTKTAMVCGVGKALFTNDE